MALVNRMIQFACSVSSQSACDRVYQHCAGFTGAVLVFPVVVIGHATSVAVVGLRSLQH